MPTDGQGQAAEPTKSAIWINRRPWPAQVPSWLVERLRLGVGHARGRASSDLRHTAVALWIAAGANPKEVSVRAGHTSVAFTLDRYGLCSRVTMRSCATAWTPCTPRASRPFPAARWGSCPAARRGPARPQRGPRRSRRTRRPGARPGLGWADGGAPPGTRTPNRCLKRATGTVSRPAAFRRQQPFTMPFSLPGLSVADPWMPSVCAPSVPHSLSVQQFLELLEIGGHGVPDTWHGDSPEQAARTAEF